MSTGGHQAEHVLSPQRSLYALALPLAEGAVAEHAAVLLHNVPHHTALGAAGCGPGPATVARGARVSEPVFPLEEVALLLCGIADMKMRGTVSPNPD